MQFIESIEILSTSQHRGLFQEKNIAARPYWSAQIRISLVWFSITLTSGLKRSSQMPLHEIYRKSGGRIHHQNVSKDRTAVEREDIVRKYRKEL